MTITPTARTSQLAGHVGARGVTAAGAGYAAVKISLEQLAGQAAGQAGSNAASLHRSVPVDQLPLLDWIAGGMALVASLVDGWTHGLAGTGFELVLPVGGPVWAGLIPLGATLAGLRRVGRWIRHLSLGGAHRFVLTQAALLTSTPALADRGIRVVGNASPRLVGHDGRVSLSILVVDDSGPFRELAGRLLARDGFDVVGTASTSAEALSSITALRPQVALVDINLGGDSGFEVARRLAAGASGTAVVLMSTHSEAEFAELLAQSPAVGFVAKERLSGDAVRLAVSGTGI